MYRTRSVWTRARPVAGGFHQVVASQVTTRVVPHIGAVSRREWNALVGPDAFYTTHGWLDGLRHSFGNDPVVLAEDHAGRLLGGVPTWPGETDPSDLFDLTRMLPGLHIPAEGWLWLGPRRGTQNALVGPAPGTRPILGPLLDRTLALARSRGLDGVVMPYLPSRYALLLAAAHPRARALLHSADTLLPIPQGGLEAYLAKLGRRDRHRRRRELRDLSRSGAQTAWRPFTPDLQDTAVRLITQNRARYGGTPDESWMRRSIAAQRAVGVLDDAYASVVTRDDSPVAIAILYGCGDRLHARYFGFDYARHQPAGEYFVALYQTPLQHAAKAGYRHYHLGISAWPSKIRRGAELVPQAAVILPVNGTVCSDDQAAEHNAQAVRAWRAIAPGRPHAYGPAWSDWVSQDTES
ncbi:GNAT family N-acetyltransferase [Actinomadura sp. KC06]|uniref:GNAT family N-acetyltransferase n=1 Tax=Actinomadura sp. KC06 TaxID=2530369 RepID=UPI001404ED32|nr:GNAT family N-acetyltransferase [Actinomadura sp. KC06]